MANRITPLFLQHNTRSIHGHGLYDSDGHEPSTNGHGYSINDKCVASGEQFAQCCGEKHHPVRQGMQATIEPRHTDTARQGATRLHDLDRSFMMIGKLVGRNHGNRHNFCIWYLGPNIALMIQMLHHSVDHDKSGYHPIGVHWLLLGAIAGVGT